MFVQSSRARSMLRGRWLATAAIFSGLTTLSVAASAAPQISGFNATEFQPNSHITIFGSGFGNAQGASFVLFGDRAIPILAWSDLAISGFLTPAVVGTPLGEGIEPNVVVVRMPANERSNAVPLPLAVAQTPTPDPATPPTTTPDPATTPAASEVQLLNDALSVERLAAAFFNANATKPYLTAGVTTPGTTTPPPTTPGTDTGDTSPGALQDTGSALSATLSGSEEVPPSGAAGTGTATFTFNQDQTQLAYDVRLTGLTGPATAMHLHRGARGVAGDIVYPMTTPDASGVSTGSITVAAADVDALLQGGFYLNVHTAAHPGGEIRGQVVAATEPAPGTTPPGTTPPPTPGATPSANLDALRGIVDEVHRHHNEHVTTLEQALGTNAQPTPTFQNLDAPTLQQFLTMAQTIEDFAVSAHQGLLNSALGITTVGTTNPDGTTTPAPATVNANTLITLLAMLLDDARHAGAIRAYRKSASTADGGDPSLTLTEDGGPLNVARNRDQILAFIQPFLSTGATAPGTGTDTTPGTGTDTGTGTTPTP